MTVDIDLWQVLGLEPGATPDEVRSAYRALVTIYHPDRYVAQPERVRLEAERRMKQLNEAHEVLLQRRPASAPPAPTGRAARRRSAPRTFDEGDQQRKEEWSRTGRFTCPRCAHHNVAGRRALRGEIRCERCNVVCF